MHSKLKILGLALVAALALTAVMASTASAQFTSSAEHTILSGTQEGSHHFSANSGFGSITCTTARFDGTSKEADKDASTITITPTYDNCTSLGDVVHILKNTLEYHFTRTGKDANGTPIGNVIVTGEITMLKTAGVDCEINIKGEQTLGGITYHNTASGVKVTTNSSGIKSHLVTGGYFGCGTSTTNPVAGIYTGTTNMIGNGATISVD